MPLHLNVSKPLHIMVEMTIKIAGVCEVLQEVSVSVQLSSCQSRLQEELPRNANSLLRNLNGERNVILELEIKC